METIFFTGFSGTGKTMIGRMLASRKDLKFLDTDEAIVKKEGNSVENIFNDKGESYFRQLERYVIHNNVTQGMIVSLGGGTVIDTENRHYVKSHGRVIYLRANANTIVTNLKDDYIHRPLLKTNFSIFTVIKLMEERRKYYEELANYIIDIDGKTIKEIFESALAIYNYINKVKCHIFIK